MKCPNCSHEIETPQMRWQAQTRAMGRCTGCGAVKSEADERYWRCAECRRKRAAYAANSLKRKQGRHRRKVNLG